MRKLSQTEWIAVAVSLLVVAVVFYIFAPLRLGNFDFAQDQEAIIIDQSLAEDSGLIVQDITMGEGAIAEKGSELLVHYVGRFTNGKEFDSSVGRGQPFSFVLGEGRVIAGWEEGLEGMRVGGRRVLVIPPELGYGSDVTGPIQANSTLIFEVLLLDVR